MRTRNTYNRLNLPLWLALLATGAAALAQERPPAPSAQRPPATKPAPPPKPAAPPAPAAGKPVVEGRVDEFALVDAAKQATEQELAALIRRELAADGAASRLAGRKLVELSPRSAAMSALETNLAIQRADIARRVAEAAIVEAKAVFNPVLLLSFAYNRSETFTRIERDLRLRPASRVDARGRNIVGSDPTADTRTQRLQPSADSRSPSQRPGNDLAVNADRAGAAVGSTGGLTAGVAGPGGASVSIPGAAAPASTSAPAGTLADNADPRSPRAEFVNPRPETLSPTRVVASQAPLTGPTESFNYNVTVFQQLPWGANLTVAYQAVDQDTFFINNSQVFANNPDPARAFVGFGSYDRPWVSSLLLNFVLPLPGSKDFGPLADQHVNIRLAELARDRAFWDVATTVNTTLRDVELGYWRLVNGLLSLETTVTNRERLEQLLARTDRILGQGAATNYDMAQVEAELARVQGQQESAWNEYIVASNDLVRLLNIKQDSLLLPSGYTGPLREAYPIEPDKALAQGSAANPELRAVNFDVRAADLEQQRRTARTRPDVSLQGQARFSQSNRVYGHESFGDSLGNIADPDTISQRYAVNYRYPWGNYPFKARLSQALALTEQQQLQARATDNNIQRDLGNGLAALATAGERIAITESNLKLAELAFQKAVQRQDQREVTEYEIVQQNQRLLTARLDQIRALTDRKQAEVQVLAALGTLRGSYAERMAQTELDRHRLKLLAANGVLQIFGTPAEEKP
jgi:outer membrane protein TolC